MTNFPLLSNAAAPAPIPAATDDVGPTVTLAGMLESAPPVYDQLTRPVTVTGYLLSLPDQEGTVLFQSAAGSLALDLSLGLQGVAAQTNDALPPLGPLFDSAVSSRQTLSLTLAPSVNGGGDAIKVWLSLPLLSGKDPLSSAPVLANAPTASLTSGADDKAHYAFMTPQTGDQLDLLSVTDVFSKTTKPADLTMRVATEPSAPSAFQSKQVSAQANTAWDFLNLSTPLPHATKDLRTADLSGQSTKSALATLSALRDLMKGQEGDASFPSSLSADAHASAPFPGDKLAASPALRPFRFDGVASSDKPGGQAQPNQQIGTVSSLGDDGPTLIAVKDDVYLLRAKVPWRDGTRLLLTPLESAPAATKSVSTDARTEDSLSQLDKLFPVSDPASLFHLAATRLPSVETNLSSSLLFLLQALKAGDIDTFVDQAVESRSHSKDKDALARAVRDVLTQPDRPALDPIVGRWHEWHVPLHAGGVFHTMALYVRDEKREETEALSPLKEKRTRFVVAIDLSRLGPMQLDGLAQGKRLDLIVRSEAPLDKTLQNSLTQTWGDTLETLGMQGVLRFQFSREGWISFTPAASGAEVLT